MRSEIKGALLAGVLTLSGMGGSPQPTRAETDTRTARLGTETPTLVFNQEAYVPNESDGASISEISTIFLETSSNPQFFQQMLDRYYSEFDIYFDIYKAPNEFGFQYSPYGKDKPVLIDYAYYKGAEGEDFVRSVSTLSLTVGDDGTLFTPREEVVSFLLEDLPEIIDSNFTGVIGVNGIEWETDLADPLQQAILTQVDTPMSSVLVGGNTQGQLFYGTELIASVPAQQ